MRIDVYLTPGQIDELQLRDKNVVVIDVLRTGTTIATALSNGAKEVIPVESVEAAVKISASLFGEVVLLGGERGGKIIEGFHLGNSPSEYAESVVKGKSIVFTTTNGALALAKGRYAKQMVIAAFVNIARVVDFIRNLKEDIFILCAGNQSATGGFSLEDAVCAGMIIHKVEQGSEGGIELSDSASGALILYRSFARNISRMLEGSEHGRHLVEIGFKDDLKTCASIDSIPVLPLLSGSVIRLAQDSTTKE
jgi:2-phosphosulfolactate phosphatase